MCVYKQDLELNNLQGLICQKFNQPTNQPTNHKEKPFKHLFLLSKLL